MSKFYKSVSLEITVFACGALVMTFEIIGSRILSPFIGTSTYIWTSLIGVILASLSLGYWAGGRLADRKPDVKILASVIFTAGGMISVTILVKDLILSMIAAASLGIEIKALVAALLLFAPASICLGFVTPFAVRLKMTTVDKTGSTVGRLYALSTAGSIAGTFAAGFFLIPFVGSVRTLYFIAASLIILSLLLVPLAVSRANIAAIVLFILGVASNEANSYILRQNNGLHDIDTEYSRIQIFETKDPATGKPIRALATDPYFVQSAAFLDSDDLVLEYSRYYHLIRHFKPDFNQTLIIGGAGYSLPKEYLRTYPTAKIDVVEIDPQMTQIARDHFRMQDDARMQIIHEDGRMYVNRVESNKYDAILMDAFGSLFTVPTHLTTVEAVTQFHRILTDDGVIIFNVGAAITGPASKFLNAELRTYKQVFPHVYLFKVNPEYPDDRLQNLIIVASKSSKTPLLPEDGRLFNSPPVLGGVDAASADGVVADAVMGTDAPVAEGVAGTDPLITSLLNHLYTAEIPQLEPILTDDLAPVEFYNSIAQNLYLSQNHLR